MAYSFGSQGALPKSTLAFGVPMSGSTPASRALIGAGGVPIKSPSIPAAASAPTNQPIKKQTVTTAGGDTHTTEYHPPAVGLLQNNSSNSTPNASGGSTLSAPGYGGANGTPADTSTGMLQTPNGAQVTAEGNITTPAQQPTPTYAGLISSVANSAQGNKDIGQKAADIAAEYGKEYADVGRKGANAKSGYLSTGTTPVAVGNSAIIAQNTAAQQEAIARGEEAALQGTGQELTAQNQTTTGLLGAAGATAPIQVPYSSQLINPATGQSAGGASGNLTDAVSTVVQRIQSGQMSYDQGVQALGGYGQGGVNALQQALGPNFNVSQSNALAGQQGTIGPAFSYAKTAIANLKSAVAGLSNIQNTNVPIINLITQGASTAFGVGSEAVQAYKGAIAEARSAIQKVLASVQGGTPTDYVGQSNALLPDSATPAQIQAAENTLEKLGQAKVDIYGNPGASSTNSNANTNTTQPAGWL